MRKLTYSFLSLSVLLSSLAFSGCKKDETDNLSRVKDYAAITLNGPALTSIEVGETYTDPGASVTFRGEPISAQVTGRVNNTTPGFYYITYRGANTEGDTVQASRVVAVVTPAAASIDQSGSFERSGSPVTITRISKGLYTTNNFGGVATTSAAFGGAYFAQLTATSLRFPSQNTSVNGAISVSGLTATFNSTGVLTSFSYVPVSSVFNYGTTARVFNRR